MAIAIIVAKIVVIAYFVVIIRNCY